MELLDSGEEEAQVGYRPPSSSPHYGKLRELLDNPKLPAPDRPKIQRAIGAYQEWLRQTRGIQTDGALAPDDRVRRLVDALNTYKRIIEIEVIWDSTDDFLHRQRGQIKIEASILEEFLPHLVHPTIIPALRGVTYEAGPRRTFSASYFLTTLTAPSAGAGMQIRTKDHDFTVGRSAYLKASFDAAFPAAGSVTHSIYLAFVAAECKTNLDKTMFQEAAATAHDLKVAIPGARYYLLCEWLDMTPISSAATDIDEVIILRGKRLPSNVRAGHSSREGREAGRPTYVAHLDANPVRQDRVLRFVNHLRALFEATEPEEREVLDRGYF